MDISVLNERLIITIWDHCRTALVLLSIITFLLFIDVIYYSMTKDNNGISLWRLPPFRGLFQSRFTTKEQICFKIVAIGVVLFFIGCSVFPASKDYFNQQYIQATALYSRNADESDDGLFSNGYVRINIEGCEQFLELPADWSENEFPLGSFYGTVCYSQNSKIILSFTNLSIKE